MANRPTLKDQRLRIMDGVFAWEGEIGNARLRDLFDIQVVQAGRLMGEFRSRMGNKIYEDCRSKTVKLAAPEVTKPEMTLDEYTCLNLETPCIVDARISLHQVSPFMFSTVRKAAVSNLGMTVMYASLENPVFEEQTIFPHTIVQIGRSWLVRAWSETEKGFQTFELGHIKDLRRLTQKASNSAGDDSGWNRLVKIQLSAHRALSSDQQVLVRFELLNGAKSKRFSVRACLAAHVLHDLRVAVDPIKQLPPDFLLEAE